MSTWAFPVLRPENVQQPDVLGQMGKMMALRQQMALQPLQIQAMQQEAALRQQQVNDVQAGQTAYNEWDGKNYDELSKLIIKHGGSLNAANQVAMYGLNAQEKAASILKTKAQAGEAQVNTTIKNNDLLAGAIDATKSLSDDQLMGGVSDLAHRAATGEFGPTIAQHAQQAQQIAASNLPPDQVRQALSIYQKGLMAETQINKNALEQAQATKTGAEAVTAQAAAKDYQDWQQRPENQGKTFSDYQAEKAAEKAKAVSIAELPAKLQVAAQMSGVIMNREMAMDFTHQVDSINKDYNKERDKIDRASSDIADASKTNNIVSARAAIAALAGVEVQDLSQRMTAQMFKERFGSLGTQFASRFQDVFTGNAWTPQMAKDAQDFLNRRRQVAIDNANNSLDQAGMSHGIAPHHLDSVRVAPPSQTAPSIPGGQGARPAPDGTVIQHEGKNYIKQGGQWVPQ